MVQRNISPNDNIEKLSRETQQLALEKENQDWKFNNCWFYKKRKLWFGPNNNSVLPETPKFPLLTTVYASKHWAPDKMIAFVDQYWWGNINKTSKSANLTCPTCPKYNPGKPVCTAPGHFKLPNGPFEVWQMHFIQLPLSN